MIDEKARRRLTFVEGTKIRLADGQYWSLPGRWSECLDPEYDATFAAVFEAEDNSERLLAELALTILLLSRNYELTPEQFQEILSFPPNAPTLAEMQRAVHEMVLADVRSSRTDTHLKRNIDPQKTLGPNCSNSRTIRIRRSTP